MFKYFCDSNSGLLYHKETILISHQPYRSIKPYLLLIYMDQQRNKSAPYQSHRFSTPKNKDRTNIEILIKGPKHEIPIQ